MAVISSIRKRAGLLVFVIAIAMVSFLLMDALSSNSNLLSGRSNNVGEINGNEISIQDFEQRYFRVTEEYKLSNNVSGVDEATAYTLREQTWNQFVQDLVLGNTCTSIGIKVTGDELFDMVQGPNPHPSVKQAFTNPQTGAFDPAQVLNFLKNKDADETGDAAARWLSFEKFLLQDRLRNKYNGLVKKGLYIPKWQAEMEHFSESKTANIKYISIPYGDIGDEEISFDDNDLNEYIKRNKSQYKQEESRTIDYVAFDIIPSPEDTEKVSKWINNQLDPFQKADDDSLFVRLNSDEPFDNAYLRLDELTTSMKDSLFKIDTGVVIGPYFEDGSYKLTKLLDRKKIADSVKVSHILLQYQDAPTFAQAQKDLDSLKKLVESGVDFAELARDNSRHEATASQGGDLGWVKPNELWKPFNDAIFFRATKGDLKIVNTQIGMHLVKVEESTPGSEAVKTANVVRTLSASSKTGRAVFSKANEFAGRNRNLEAVKAAAEEAGMVVKSAENIKKNANFVQGLGQTRDIVKWAYKASEGDVSKVFSVDDKYVVVILTSVQEEGQKPLELVRTEVEIEVKKEKKVAHVKDKISGTDGLDAMASLFNQTVRSASNLTFTNPRSTEIGSSEPKLIATCLGLQQGEVSEPVMGTNAVFIATLESVNEPASLQDYSTKQRLLSTTFQSNVDFYLFDAMKEMADIEDNRFVFY